MGRMKELAIQREYEQFVQLQQALEEMRDRYARLLKQDQTIAAMSAANYDQAKENEHESL